MSQLKEEETLLDTPPQSVDSHTTTKSRSQTSSTIGSEADINGKYNLVSQEDTIFIINQLGQLEFIYSVELTQDNQKWKFTPTKGIEN